VSLILVIIKKEKEMSTIFKREGLDVCSNHEGIEIGVEFTEEVWGYAELSHDDIKELICDLGDHLTKVGYWGGLN
jgi:hypothetical protein